MKKILNLLMCMMALIAHAKYVYETIEYTDGEGNTKTVTVRTIGVPEIYEIRNMDTVSRNVSLTNYEEDIIMRKLDPQKVISVKDVDSAIATPFSAYDTQDIAINPVGAADYSVPDVEVADLTVEVTQRVYDELAAMKDMTAFENSYAVKQFLCDLNRLEPSQRDSWIKTLISNKTCRLQRIRSKKRYRTIGEAMLLYGSFDENRLIANLNALKNAGYDSVLFRFDCTEDIALLGHAADVIKNNGFEIFSSYVGLDNQCPRWNPFIDRERLETYLELMCGKSVGLYLNWRSTSSHTKLLPKEYFNYLCNKARACNPSILIYGEIYYGPIDPLGGEKKLMYTIPDGVTGAVINNMGYYGYNQAYVVNRMFAKYISDYNRLEKIGQVIGIAPYYCSRNDLNLSLEQEYDYKRRVENSFNRVGCGTITMLHDGVDDNQTGENCGYHTVDNILYDLKISHL